MASISKYDMFPASILFGFCITTLYPVLIHTMGWIGVRKDPNHKIGKTRATWFGTFEACALRMFIMQVLASQLHFLANRNAELALK